MAIQSPLHSPVRSALYSPLVGKWGAASNDVRITYLGHVEDASDQTTYSGGVWNNVNFGAPAANRKIVVAFGARNTTAVRTLVAVTIGGVAATAAVPLATADFDHNYAAIYVVDMPTGASGNIVVQWSGAQLRQGAAIYAIYGAGSSTPISYNSSSVNGDYAPVGCPDGSVAIGYSISQAGTSATWSLTTKDIDTSVEATILHSAAHATIPTGTGGQSIGVGVSWAGGSTPASVYGAWAPAGAIAPNDVLLADAARTWFNTPSTIKIGADDYAAGVTAAGDIVVGKNGGTPVVLKAALQVDDHDNPGLLRRSSDGRIVAAYCRHGADNNYYVRISTNPDDMSSFGAEANIGATIASGENLTYSNMVEITDGLFNFFRTGNASFKQRFTTSTDGGATWSAATIWFDGPARPYYHIAKNGANRFDIFCGDGNPDQTLSGIYHFYYDAGVWKKSDGTSLGSPPFTTSQFTKIWDSASANSWAWDAKAYSGVPVLVYAVFPTTTDHRYRFAKWNGSSWNDYEICTAGGTIYPTSGGEDYYSGGVCLDPDNANVIYCSRVVGAYHQIFKGTTTDGGATWALTQLTFTSEKKFRPQKLAGSSYVTYMVGTYTTYLNYKTRIQRVAA